MIETTNQIWIFMDLLWIYGRFMVDLYGFIWIYVDLLLILSQNFGDLQMIWPYLTHWNPLKSGLLMPETLRFHPHRGRGERITQEATKGSRKSWSLPSGYVKIAIENGDL